MFGVAMCSETVHLACSASGLQCFACLLAVTWDRHHLELVLIFWGSNVRGLKRLGPSRFTSSALLGPLQRLNRSLCAGAGFRPTFGFRIGMGLSSCGILLQDMKDVKSWLCSKDPNHCSKLVHLRIRICQVPMKSSRSVSMPSMACSLLYVFGP